MKISKASISAVLIFAMLFSFAPSIISGIAQNAQAAEQQQRLELHAFYPAQLTFSEQSKKYIDSLDSISFAWARMYSDLSEGINTTLGKNGNTMFYYPKDYVEVLRYTKSKNKSMRSVEYISWRSHTLLFTFYFLLITSKKS